MMNFLRLSYLYRAQRSRRFRIGIHSITFKTVRTRKVVKNFWAISHAGLSKFADSNYKKKTYPVISTFISVGLSSSVRKNIADEKSRGKEVDSEDSSCATRKIIEALGMPALVKALE